jgi:hypothetical protein
LQFARKIATDWFPSDNFTTRPMPAGNLVVNGNALGKMDITVIPGQTIAPSEAFTNVAINDDLFSQTKDIASAWIVVKGNLTLNNTAILRQKVRKLLTSSSRNQFPLPFLTLKWKSSQALKAQTAWQKRWKAPTLPASTPA